MLLCHSHASFTPNAPNCLRPVFHYGEDDPCWGLNWSLLYLSQCSSLNKNSLFWKSASWPTQGSLRHANSRNGCWLVSLDCRIFYLVDGAGLPWSLSFSERLLHPPGAGRWHDDAGRLPYVVLSHPWTKVQKPAVRHSTPMHITKNELQRTGREGCYTSVRFPPAGRGRLMHFLPQHLRPSAQ